jgi:hypothetical protein
VPHHGRPLSAELVPYRVSGADRATSIARSRLHVHLLERRLQRDLSIGHRIHAATAGDGHRIETVPGMQGVQ